MHIVKNKSLIITLLLLLTPPFFLFAQNYQNEWIDYSQTYYKFQSEETGLHRISFETLQTVNLPLNGGDFVLMTNGEQIPIYVTTNGTFQEGDFIEFYGTKNDGQLDTKLYESPRQQPNVNHSLFIDKRTYFLYSSPDVEPIRINNAPNDVEETTLEANPFFLFKSQQDITASYHFGEPITPSGYFSFLGEFSEGEGWVGSVIKDGFNQTIKVPTPALYPEAEENSVAVDLTIVGRNNAIGIVNDQEMEVWVNDHIYLKENFRDFSIKSYQFPLRPSELETEIDYTGFPRTPFVFKGFDGVFAQFFAYETKYSVASISVTYPRIFDFGDADNFLFDLNLETEKYLEISNFDHQENAILYDFNTLQRIIPLIENDTLKIHLNSDVVDYQHQLFLSNASTAIFEVTHLKEKNFLDFSNITEQGSFIILSNDSLRNHSIDPIKRYEQYRASEEGGDHQVVVVEVAELYDQFSWGIEQHPLAIQSFVNFAVKEWEIVPDYLLLLGKSVAYDKARYNTNHKAANLVPSYGQTPSDCFLVSDFAREDYRPLLATSRLPAQTPEQIHHYLDKLEIYEAQMNQGSCDVAERAWKKKVLHIAKGWGQEQTEDFQDRVDDYTPFYVAGPSGMQLINTLTDNFGPPTSGNDEPFYPAPQFENAMNDGLAMITYFGHGLSSYWQYAISTDPQEYTNEGNYPYIMSAACSVGNIHKTPGNETMVEDYVLAEKSGAIAFSASTALSSVFYIDIISELMTENTMVDYYGHSIAENLRNTINSVYSTNNIDFKKVCTEMVLVGDPAVAVYHWNKPEFALLETDWQITEEVAFGNHLELEGIVYNLGSVLSDSIELSLLQELPSGQQINAWNTKIPCPTFVDTLNLSIPIKQHIEGENLFTLKINPQSHFPEDCYDNNAIQQRVYLASCEPDCPDIPVIVNDTMSINQDTVIAGISSTDSPLQISIFPNPNQGKLTIESQNDLLESILIRNELGQQVLFKNSIRKQKIGIDISPLPKGIYFIEVKTFGGLEVLRIIYD